MQLSLWTHPLPTRTPRSSSRYVTVSRSSYTLHLPSDPLDSAGCGSEPLSVMLNRRCRCAGNVKVTACNSNQVYDPDTFAADPTVVKNTAISDSKSNSRIIMRCAPGVSLTLSRP